MAQQRVDDPSDPPPAYDSVVRPSNASGGQAPASAATTSAAPSERPSASTSQSTGVDAQGERRPRRGNSATEELDLEQEDRPLPPGWVPQYSEEHDRFFFVDTLAPGGPRSIWTHPLDDPEWLKAVPAGMDPVAYVHKLWADQPTPSQEERERYHQSVAQELAAASNQPSGPVYDQSSSSSNANANANAGGAGYRQGGTIRMQQNYPGTSVLQGGQRTKLTMEDLTQYYLSKMGTPEEYERKHPRSKFSKLFHEKESPAERQRRHAEHKARNLADAMAYRAPVYRPGPYGYPGYGRGYGGMYPGMGLSGGLLGLGAGAMLGAAMF